LGCRHSGSFGCICDDRDYRGYRGDEQHASEGTRAHQELRMREMEHERRIKEMEIEKAKIELERMKVGKTV
jgi:hypothetical protein